MGATGLCRLCGRRRSKAWKVANPEKYKLSQRKQDLKKRLNFTIEQYNKLFSDQKGCCAGCGRHQSEFKRNLAVDHDHATSRIRGLLCNSCNLALGMLSDQITTLQNLIKYLENHNSVPADNLGVGEVLPFERKSKG